MRRRQKCFLAPTERDHALLMSLWKWKVGTTAAIAEEFFQCPFSDAAYRRLQRLARYQYICSVPFGRSGEYGWVLTEKGFKTILPFLPELKEVGFRSEALHHDHICSSLQRGPWISKLPGGMEHFSEQELRRLSPQHYPAWVPQSEVHRPDGYSRVLLLGRPITVAFEVELNRKKAPFYDLVAKFYKHTSSTYRIIWLTATQADARWIQKQFIATTPNDYLMHLFILLEDFKAKFWQSTIFLGHEAGKPLDYLLARGVSLSYLYRDTPPILDTRKRPYISKVYAASKQARLSDRVSFSTLASHHFPIPSTPKEHHANTN